MKTHAQILDEAHAQIIWGDDPIEVYTWMREQGVPERLSTELLRRSSRERESAIRKSGIRSVFMGILLMLGGATLMWVMMTTHILPGRPTASPVGAILIVFGAYRSIVGAFRLFSGHEAGAISDLD